MPTAANLYYYVHEAENYARPPVILIHGAGGTHLHWPPEIRRLSNQRVFALDLPGHGKSVGVGKQSVTDYTQNVIDFMHCLGLSAAVIVGHSMGGAIALTLALKHPKCVLGLGLVATGARLRVVPAILDSTANPGNFSMAIQVITDWAFGSQASPNLKELAAQRMTEIRPTVLHGDFLACDRFDVLDKLDQLQIPTAIICGTEDKLTPPRYSEYLRAHIPTARLHMIEAAGHMVMLEKPDRVANTLAAFLNKISTRPGKQSP